MSSIFLVNIYLQSLNIFKGIYSYVCKAIGNVFTSVKAVECYTSAETVTVVCHSNIIGAGHACKDVID